MQPARIHPLLSWGIPVLMMILQIMSELLVPDAHKPEFFSEEGPHEKFQAIFMVVAVVYAVRLLFAVEGLWLKLWFGVAALSCFYVAGEEMSWGQHFFGWVTPEFWDDINDQQETNLHNTSSWLDQKPMIVLQIGVLVGGIIIPLLQRFRPDRLPVKYAPIYATWDVVVSAAFALFVKFVDTVQDLTDQHIFWRASEVLELYIFYFVMLYMILMWQRFKPQKRLTTS